MRILLSSVAAAALFTSGAYAADVYEPMAGGLKDAPVYVPVNTWTGFYIGANGGYGWNADKKDLVFTSPVTGFRGVSRGLEPEGGFGGGQAGYNWQRGTIVFGIETDIQGSDIRDSYNNVVVPSNSGPLGVSAKESVDFFGTVRGRIGYAMDRTLIYATGGFAYGEVNSRFDLTNGAATARLTRDRTDTGFAVGGGLEYALNPAWSFKVEYQYIDLGSEKATGTSSNGVFLTTNEIDTNFHTVRVGINYHIHDDYVPLK